MTAKEQLLQRVQTLSETEAAETLRLLDQRTAGYPSVFPVPAGRAATAADFEEHFGDLPFDDEP